MLASERMATAVAVGGVVSEVSRIVEEIQRSVWRHWLRVFGLSDTPIANAHRLHLAGTHRAIRGSVQVAAFATGAALAATTRPEAVPMADKKGGAIAQTAVASFYADRLTPRLAPLAPTMSVRVAGRGVELNRASLASAFPDATDRIAIFLHGLMATERSWGADTGFGARLQADHDFTPVHVRFNAGIHIADNGRLFAELLEQLAAEWPVSVGRVILVGHSMGGLIMRSACELADELGHVWPQRVESCFYLGAPNHGAALERGVAVAAAALERRQNRHARNLARLLNQRSPGIKDLRHGSILECEYDDNDPHRRELLDHRDIPLRPGIAHHFVAATLLPQAAAGRASEFIGDGMVSPISATGSHPSGKRAPFLGAQRHYLPGLPHARLPMDDRVYQVIDSVVSQAR